MSYQTVEELARETAEWYRFLRGMVRRVAVTLTSATKWQVLGQRGGSGGDETWDVEPFSGIGFYSRPSSSGNPEAIVTAYGSAKGTAIVATRDEATRQIGAGDCDEDESYVFNSVARVAVKKSGIVEIRLHGGAVFSLARNDEHKDTRDKLNEVITAVNSATGGTITPLGDPNGTSVLKGQ